MATRKSPAKNLIAALEGVIKNLPSREEKSSSAQACAEVAAFFAELEKRLASMPSKEDGERILTVLKKLEETLLVANNSSLRAILGLGAARRRAASSPRSSRERAELLGIEELQKLPADELGRKLQDENRHPLPQIRQIALELGVSDVARTPRAALVQQIAKKIENFRGYQRLRDAGS